MASEMQTRIAAAIMNVQRKKAGFAPTPLEFLPPEGRDHYLMLALAAMRAMREPTPVMVDAGWNARSEVDARYTAMVNAEIAAAEEPGHDR